MKRIDVLGKELKGYNFNVKNVINVIAETAYVE
jgi:hypothetical protein